jgi:hypothetical protein
LNRRWTKQLQRRHRPDICQAIANPEKDTPQRRAAAALLADTGLTPEVFGQVCGIVESEQGRLASQPLRDSLHGFKALT